MWFRDKTEWRTLVLIIFCYSFVGILLFSPLPIPLLVRMLLLIPLLTLHSSLQHECIHGHPFTSQRLNDAIVFPPVGILMSYFRFKESHLKHHQNASISDPYEDPESNYQDLKIWETRPEWAKRIFEFNNTLAGRMLIGPTLSVIGFSIEEIRSGRHIVIFTWICHILVGCLLLMIVSLWGVMPIWAYLTCCYFAYSLLMVRTFLEHQADESMRARTVIVEDKGFFSFLFLNNNLHVVHHAYPTVAWYKLPAMFKGNRKRFLEMNKGYSFKNYAEIFRRFAFNQKEPVAYPFTPKKHDTKKYGQRS